MKGSLCDHTMCTGGVACLHGACGSLAAKLASDRTTNDVCLCHELYSGSQCGYRSGLLYFELPLATFVVFLFVIVGLRVSDTAWAMLRFPESTRDFFEFPRIFKPIERVHARVRRFVGTWEGPTHKGIVMGNPRTLTRVLVGLVILLEMLPFAQIAAMAFLPIVPWPTGSKITAKFLRLLLLYPLWEHQTASEYSHLTLYMAIAAVPVLLAFACILGVKRFPLFKPQPMESPAEDLCTLALRAFSSWAVLPLMIALLMPFECFFVGFLRAGSLLMIPVYDPVCFTWIRLAHFTLGLGATVGLNLLGSGVGIQLNCESSKPQPTLWTDARYTRIFHSLHPPLALSVIAFGNSNPLALCVCCALGGLCLAVLNLWMRPCIYSLVNWLRFFGGALASWTGLTGIAASVIDDPRTNAIFEIWSLGAIALTAVTFSSLFVQYSEEFWFHLSLLKARQRTSSSGQALPTSQTKGQLNDEPTNNMYGIKRIEHTASDEIVHMGSKSFKPKLPPLHVLKKRSRRSVAPKGHKIMASQ